jgi:hypothetical protein
MKTTVRICCTTALLLSLTVSGYAQSHGSASMKQELVQRMLKEKLLLPGTRHVEEGEDARTTAVTDGRVSSTLTGVDEGEISLACNPSDSSKMVLSYMEEGASLSFPIYYSSNGGSTWTKSSFNSLGIMSADFPGSGPGGGGDPVFAWDKNGTLYFGWIYLTIPPTLDTAFFTLNWAYSTDNGHTWQVKPNHFIGQGAIDITGGGSTLPYKDGITDREWFAVDNSGGPHQGNLYCSFVCFPPGASLTFMGVKTKVAGIDTFGPAVHAFNGDAQFGNVEVDKNGVLHMSFADLDNTQVRHTKSTDGGLSFTPSVVVGSAHTLFPSGPPYIVHVRENAAINMAVDGSVGTGNNVHVVWSDFPGTTVNSFYAHSTDGGNSWSTPQSLDSAMHGLITVMPTVAASGNNVAVSFTGVDANDSARYYQLNSTNNGSSFSPSSTLSSAACNYHAIHADTSNQLFFGDYNRSQRTVCQTYATWEDCRSGVTSKVYYAKTNLCALGVKEISLVNGDVQLLSLFPNPASDIVMLQLSSNGLHAVTVSLADMVGRVLINKDHYLRNGKQDVPVAISNVPGGVYIISIKDGDGMIASRQVVVK